VHRTRGRGSGGNLKRVAPAADHQSIARPRTIGQSEGLRARSWWKRLQLGRACDRRRVPFVRFERKGAGTGRAADRPALQGRAIVPSLAEDAPANQFQSPCTATARGRFIFKGSDQQLRAPCSKVVAESGISCNARRDRAPTHRPALSSRRIPADTNTQLDLFEDQGAQPLVAHIWHREERVLC
jgi:hypothetical protein